MFKLHITFVTLALIAVVLSSPVPTPNQELASTGDLKALSLPGLDAVTGLLGLGGGDSDDSDSDDSSGDLLASLGLGLKRQVDDADDDVDTDNGDDSDDSDDSDDNTRRDEAVALPGLSGLSNALSGILGTLGQGLGSLL